MPHFVALFRGINVGRAKRVPMAQLRAQLAALGYTDIATVLNSGNAVFAAPARAARSHARRIQAAVAATLGVDAQVIVVSAAEFAAVASENPLLGSATNPSRLLVAFAWDGAALSELTALAAASWVPEALAVGKHAAYLWCCDGIQGSRLAESMNRCLGERVTTRNWATVQRIGELLDTTAPESQSRERSAKRAGRG